MKVLLVVLLLTVVVVLINAFDVPQPQPRITNGNMAGTGQFKYQVGLYIQQGLSMGALCGGSLIARNWILTAAHCVEGASRVYALMGSAQFTSGTIVPVTQLFVHEQWDFKNFANDICLLKIPYFDLGSNIAPVALPPLGGYENTYVNDNVIASGWGITSDQAKIFSNQLQYARLKIIPNSSCSRIYGSALFRDTNICAQGPSRTSTCKGDSGGPLVTEYGILVGITSYGPASGCTVGYPGVFTRVSSYRSWIYRITGV